MAGIFIFRGLSSISIHHYAERISYFFLSSFVLIGEYIFTHNIKHDAVFRNDYLNGKGDILHDFDKLADQLPRNMFDLVNIHTGLCIAVPILTYLIYVIYNFSRSETQTTA